MSFQMFADQKTRKTNENDYLGLSHDYFSKDIQIVLNELQRGELSRDAYMGQDLIEYINILNEPSDKRKKINLVMTDLSPAALDVAKKNAENIFSDSTFKIKSVKSLYIDKSA